MLCFIIPAHNEARLLGETLETLVAAARRLDIPYEIIVVDDASTDATVAIATHHAAKVVSVAYRHIAAVRNAGANATQGEFLVFVDADTHVTPTVLRAALAAMRAGAVGGGARIRLHGAVNRYERWAEGCLAYIFRLTGIAPGCFLFCTRAAFAAVGGFNENYYAGEDVAMSRALARQGKFVILRESVSTSPRKLRTFTAIEHLRLILRFLWVGRSILRSRRHLDLWYGDRRDDA